MRANVKYMHAHTHTLNKNSVEALSTSKTLPALNDSSEDCVTRRQTSTPTMRVRLPLTLAMGQDTPAWKISFETEGKHVS